MFKNKTFAIKTLTITVVVLLASMQLSETSHKNIHAVYGQEGLASFATDVVQADANSVYFIFPDNDPSHSKPPGVSPAWLSDWTAIGFLYGMCNNMPQNTAPDTRANLFNSQTGAPLITASRLVLFGGPLVSAPVHYYEANRLAPLYFQNDGGVWYWYRADGTRLEETGLTPDQMKAGQNMFVVEAFTDNSGNRVFIVYGYGWKGTFAAGLFFKSVIYPDISSYSNSWYVYRWNDSNKDGFVDLGEIVSTPVVQG